MQLGKLNFDPIHEQLQLVADPVRRQVEKDSLSNGIYVAAIDPELADTVSFCEAYDVSLDISTNCIVVEAKRADRVWYAACLILASDMIDVNGKVRRLLDARKISFAPKDIALGLTGMEYGGITPLGLPESWPILADERILTHDHIVLGSGIRESKILTSTKVLASLPNVQVLDITK